MKTSILSIALVTISWSAFSQGKVLFGNDSNHLIVWGSPSPCGEVAGSPVPQAGSPNPCNLGLFTAQLLAGISSSSLSAVSTVAAGAAGLPDGRLANTPLILTNIPGGTPAYFQVRIYDGETYDNSTFRGVSPVFTAVPGYSSFSFPPIWSSVASSTWANGPISLGTCLEGALYWLEQPTSLVVVQGDAAAFSVRVEACPAASYQWRFNGTPIQGATASNYQIANVQPTDTGNYSVEVRNWWRLSGPHSITSTNATLTVLTGPTIIFPPQSQTGIAGRFADLTVVAQGLPPLAYQWSFNGSAIPGATGTDLNLTNLEFSQAGTYTVVVTNAFGAVTSPPALLTVIAASNPQSGTVVSWGEYVVPYVEPGTRFTAVAGDMYRGLALRSDGRVVAWGRGCSVPTDLSGVTAIAAGGWESLALRSDGTVVAWAWGGQAQAPVGLSGIIAIAAGEGHSLALKSDHTVVAWGDNSYGQTNVPTGLSSVIAIAAGGYHNLALKSDGTVVAWGAGGPGQTGYWDFGQSVVPTGLACVIAVSGGRVHSLALKSNGTVVAWGNNSAGQTNAPAGLTDVVAVAGGVAHSLALMSGGTAVAWGSNYSGLTNVPPGLNGLSAIAAGGYHNLALKSDGKIVAWGNNDFGQCMTPGGLAGVTALATGGDHNLALKSDSTVFAWGRNSHGESTIPARLTNVVGVAAGGYHSLALKADGTVVAWGDNSYGETNIPPGLHGVVAIAASGHSLALKSDGTVVAWGRNAYGQSTVPAGLRHVVAIEAGGAYSLALKSDGTVVGWGDDSYGQVTGVAGMIAKGIAAGQSHSLVLRSNGTVVARGRNWNGETSVPWDLTGVTNVDAGGSHSLALKSDGTITVWGYNNQGQTNVPPELPAAILVAGGSLSSLALVVELPTIEVPPASQTTEIGSTARFQVRGNGSSPLACQWFFNSTTRLGGATNTILVLPDVQASQAGVYTVVVTNIAGSATSPPARLQVITPVDRRLVPSLTVIGQPQTSLNLDFTDTLGPIPQWTTLDIVPLNAAAQRYFDLTTPLPPQRFYRAWQTGTPSVLPALSPPHMVPALTLTGAVGDKVRVDAINQFGPTDAWFTLATVTLTNTSQLYFDVTAPGQPTRLYRLVPLP